MGQVGFGDANLDAIEGCLNDPKAVVITLQVLDTPQAMAYLHQRVFEILAGAAKTAPANLQVLQLLIAWIPQDISLEQDRLLSPFLENDDELIRYEVAKHFSLSRKMPTLKPSPMDPLHPKRRRTDSKAVPGFPDPDEKVAAWKEFFASH